MCLNLLPEGKVAHQFDSLRHSMRELVTDRNEKRMLNMLFTYMDDQWIDNHTWPPSTWSVFMQKVYNDKITLKG